MESYKHQFIELCIQHNILTFGDFTLKSGRKSPYFFNAGLFYSGAVMAQVGQSYAAVVSRYISDEYVLFGPAYKGIPLVVATAMAMHTHTNQNVDYGYNRKESKDHGEGGVLVGAPIKGRSVVVLDDVVTAGTAFRETMDILKQNGAHCRALILALDRQEKGVSGRSTVDELQQDFQVPVYSIMTITTILDYLNQAQDPVLQQSADAIARYRTQYGA